MSDALSREDLELLGRLAAEGIVPVAPPPLVRARVLAAIKPLDDSVPGSHESVTVRAEEGKWTEVAPGARLKKLNKDAARGTLTCLLELDPHALVPAHDHEGGEDSYVIRGSCRIGALALNVGDYHHADAASHHGDIVASAEGCLLLITVDAVRAA